MKENTIYVEKHKSMLGDIRVSGTFDNETYAVLGKLKNKSNLIESTRKTLATVNRYGNERYNETNPYLGHPDIPNTKFPIEELK